MITVQFFSLLLGARALGTIVRFNEKKRMIEFYQFAIEIIISISISAITIVIVNKPLKSLLFDVCGTEERAKFWVVYSDLMLVITPILSILIFGSSGIERMQDFAFYKRAFGVALFGLFISLLAIGLQITKTIPTRETEKKNTE